MELSFDGDRIRGGTEARERFYDSRGYGRPAAGGLELAPVEAVHLLFRGDLDAVQDRRETADRTGDRLEFDALLASSAVSEVGFFVYKELRDRGFYLSPAREDWVEDDRGEFLVYPRGDGPWDDTAAYRVWAVSERTAVSADTLREIARVSSADDEVTGVLAVVDEESEVTYLELTEPTITGSTHHKIPAFEGELLSDRVLVSQPPSALHEQAFYGQRLDRDREPLQLSLVEAAYLSTRGLLDGPSETQLVSRGRAVEGDRFDRRLRAYSALRTAGVVPKTGYKFGADFRTYANVDSVDSLGHSELLVRVVQTAQTFSPRDLALDVRLAHGVRKQLVFGLTSVDAGVDWLAVSRLTP